MTASETLRGLLLKSPAVAATIVDFNWDPAAYIHSSQRQYWLPEIPHAAWNEPRLIGRLSNLLLERSGLQNKYFIDTPSDLWPLALLPADRLQRLALHIGALVLGIRVRSSLSREHVLSWKRRLGEEAYKFSMNSASLLPTGKVPLTAIATEAADELGASVIIAALAKTPEALRRRVALKFPKEVAALDLDPDKAVQLSLMIARIVEGEWFSSFAALRK